MSRLGKNEVYAKRSITVQLTPDDVACAVKGDPYHCVLAQAFRANPLFGAVKDVRVLNTFTKLHMVDGPTQVFATPKDFKKTLKKWDNGKGVWDGPDSGLITFGVCQDNRRTPEQKERTKQQDLIRKHASGKPIVIADSSSRHRFKIKKD